MTHRPRTRLLLLAAALSALGLMPPAHADGLRFTYSTDQWMGGYVLAAPASALEPVLGPVTLEGSVTFRPSGASFRITIDDAVVPDGTGVPVRVGRWVGGQWKHSEHCVPVGSAYSIPVVAKAEIGLSILGARHYPWQPCGAPATVGTAEIAWG